MVKYWKAGYHILQVRILKRRKCTGGNEKLSLLSRTVSFIIFILIGQIAKFPGTCHLGLLMQDTIFWHASQILQCIIGKSQNTGPFSTVHSVHHAEKSVHQCEINDCYF